MSRDTVQRIVTMSSTVHTVDDHVMIRDWLISASIEELQEYISKVGYLSNYHQIAVQMLQGHYSKASLAAIESLKEITLKHTEHSKTLTNQTDILISESKKLGRLTWGLLLLTIVLAILTGALLFIDWHKELEHTKPSSMELKNITT